MNPWTPFNAALDRLWENRSDNVRWLESLGDLPSRLNAEAREEISSTEAEAVNNKPPRIDQ